jgi:hypothetical protein
MMTGGNLDWLFLVAGGVVGLGGLVLLVWAIFRDRARGRRRCPRCWYDMAGTPELVCPECGHHARIERRLYRTRRRWRRASLGLVIVLLGVCIAEVPAYRRGWTALVPATVLALFAPAQDPTPRGAFRALGFGPGAVTTTIVNGRMVVATPPTPAPAAAPIPQQLTDEFWKRLEIRKTRGWQARVFFNRYFRNNPVEFGDFLTVPDRWPVGEPIRVSVRPVLLGSVAGLGIDTVAGRGSGSEAYAPGTGHVDGVAVPSDEIEVEMRLRYLSLVLYRTTIRLPITVGGSVETFLEQLDDAETTATVREALKPRLMWNAEDPLLLMSDRTGSETWGEIDFGIAYRVELFVGDQLLGVGAGAADWTRPVWKDWDEVRFTWTSGGRERAAATPDQLRVVIHGDPAAAGRMYMNAPFGKRAACWTGQIELPAAVEPDRRP